MLKMIKDQYKIKAIQKAMNIDSNVTHTFDVEFSNDDERYNIQEKKKIFVFVQNGKLRIRLAINGRPMVSLSDEETETIKSQISIFNER